jgi:hypothetical protein
MGWSFGGRLISGFAFFAACFSSPLSSRVCLGIVFEADLLDRMRRRREGEGGRGLGTYVVECCVCGKKRIEDRRVKACIYTRTSEAPALHHTSDEAPLGRRRVIDPSALFRAGSGQYLR